MMNHFEQPIPKNPRETGSNYFADKKEQALLEYEQEKQRQEAATEAAYAPFDKPLEESLDKIPESREEAITFIKEQMGIAADVINEYKTEFRKLEIQEREGSLDPAGYFRKQILEERIVEKQEKLEKLMSHISPKEYEEDEERFN